MVYESYESKLFEKLKNAAILIFISDKSPELYKRVEVRLTRYRIARGFIINLLILIIAVLIALGDIKASWPIVVLLAGLTTISIFM